MFADALRAFRDGDLDGAAALAREAAAADAEPHQVEHLLGLIACRRGELREGIGHLKRAFQVLPENPAYRIMLARALIDADRPLEALALTEESAETGTTAGLALGSVEAEAAHRAGDAARAAETLQRIVQGHPGDAQAWGGLGAALAAQENWAGATEAFARAVQLAPADTRARRGLAGALYRAGDADRAIEALEALLAAAPASVEDRLTLAHLLMEREQPQRALAHLDAALQVRPSDTAILLQRARALVGLARFDDAQAAYRAILAGNPKDDTVTHELGVLLERAGRIAELRQLVADAQARTGGSAANLAYFSATLAFKDGKAAEADALLRHGNPEGNASRWYRLEARIADALDQPERAFAAAAAMNHSVPDYSGWQARGADYRERLRILQSHVGPTFYGTLPVLSAPPPRTPAFLLGFPRSGTTLLDTFLMGHPGVRVLEEVHMLGAAELVLEPLANLPDRTGATLEEARAAYFRVLDEVVPPGFDGLVVDKLPLNMLGAPVIHALFPGAPIIFAQRHPCDCVLSGFMQSFVLNDAMACFLDIEAAADLYDVAMALWTSACDNLPLRVHRLRYEDLVADPETQLRGVVDFLGLEWRSEMLDHQATAKRRGPISTASFDQVTEPISMRPRGRWQRYREQLAPVLPTLLPWAERLGYPA